MKRSTILAIIALVVLAAAGLYYWHYKHGPLGNLGPSGGAAPSMLSLLPPDSPYVVYADVAALRHSAFLARLVAIVPAPTEDPEYTDFVQATGFDYTRDLDRVALAILPASPRPVVWIIAEGHFDQQKIAAYALRTGSLEQHDGKNTYVMPASTPGNKINLTFLSASRTKLVTGPPVAGYTTGSTAHDSSMQDRLARVSGSMLFAVARTDAIPKDLTIGTIRLDQVASTLKGVQWLTLAANPEKENLRVLLEGYCDSSRDALQLELAASGLRMMGRALISEPSTRAQLTPQGADALAQLLRIIEISHDERRVRLSAAFTPEMLNGLAAPMPPQKHSPARNGR